MAVNYSNTVKDNRLTQVLNAVDGGPSFGTIEICSAAYAAVLVTFTFSDPSGAVSSQVLTFSGMPKTATAGNSGTAAIARIKDSTGTVVAQGLTVGTSATDVIISSTTITSGLGYSLTAAAITHAA